MLENSWKFIVDYFKNNAANTGASETASDVLLKWGYRNLGLLLHRQRQGGQRFAHLRAGRGEHIGPDAEHRRQDPERVTDAYIRIDSSFRGDKNKSLQDNNGYASSGVSYSADGSMNRFGAITGRFDHATQTIILDPIRLAGGSITLTGQIISVGNGNLIVANGYASVRIDNQTTYALVTGDIDVSTYRKGRIEIIDTARGQRDLYELNGADQVHTVWNKFVQVTNAGVGQPGWVWVYDNGSGLGNTAGSSAVVGNLGGQLTTTYKPAQGQVMVWVMGWESSETTTTTYVTKQLNLIGDGVDPLGWLTNKNTTKKGPYVTYAQSRPVLVSTVVAYTSESSVPGVLRDQLAASGKLKDVVLPNYVEGSGKQSCGRTPTGRSTSRAWPLQRGDGGRPAA